MSKSETNRAPEPRSPETRRAQAAQRSGSGDWPRLGWETRVVLVVTIAIIALAAFPSLPPGVCKGDAGDLQLASATLGVMHPPGYAGYVTLGYLLTRIPGVDPAYVISLACFASGLIALWLCALVQVRLGVNPWIASALCLLATCHTRIWLNLVEPEVYAPSMALLAGSTYLLIRYVRAGHRASLYVAALLFGFVLGNRPTVIWMVPFFCFAWWLARKRWDSSARESIAVFVRVALLGALPGVFSLGYVVVRDSPQTQYNYIESYNAEYEELPDADTGWAAKFERLRWLVTAQEFKRYLSQSVRDMWMRLRWLYLEFFMFRVVYIVGWMFLAGSILAPIAALLLAVGAALIYRRCRPTFWLLVGMVSGNVIVVCMYRIYGLAGDLLPLMFSVTVVTGAAMSPLFPIRGHPMRRTGAYAFFTIACLLMWFDTPYRANKKPPDALPFLTEVDMQTLPRNAVICSTWPESTPLWYSKYVLTGRGDIEVINAGELNWFKLIADKTDRPIFMTFKSTLLRGQEVTPYRNLWRWENPQPINR